ncbi:hypothetical protein FK216_07550 [Moraxellaceae bacterium AER2_44_116]|nr:restriction endonuclease [Moraxellaceae bacterium]TQC98135.1 hypothetical protein FK216_07550 [Moraxellaceae bacterium AER2_44_116]
MTVSYPAFERVLYELANATLEKEHLNEKRAFTYLKGVFADELPESYEVDLKDLISAAREMLDSAYIINTNDRPRSFSKDFSITDYGRGFLLKIHNKRISFIEMMATDFFIDYIHFKVGHELCVPFSIWHRQHEGVRKFSRVNFEKDENKRIYGEKGDGFLNEYIKEIECRLSFFRVYDMKKEDVDLDAVKKLQVTSAILHCVSLLGGESESQRKKSSINNIPSMIAEQNKKLREDLLAKIKVITPKQFEELSVLILGHLLYEGQPLSEFKKHLKQQGQSGDGGIDGIVTKYDRIRGNVIHYVQSKRYTTNSVQRPEVQRFVGALDPHRAKIGVFITTSKFTEGAEEYVKSLNLYDVRLVDGYELVEMMIECGIGVKKVADVALIEINNAFFDTEASLLA